MALVKGQNSYVTVAEADAYFANRLGADAYTSASTPNKEKALISATGAIDGEDFVGQAISQTQPLAFPRLGSYWDPKLGYQITFDDTDPPQRIIQAVFEMCLHLLNNVESLSETGTVESLKVGSITLTKIRSPNKINSSVSSLLSPLRLSSSGIPGGGNMWWRAN